MTRVFPNLSVIDNLLVGSHVKVRSALWKLAFALPSTKAEERALLVKAVRVLEFIGLTEFHREPAGKLSIGQRRILQLGMALDSEPRVLMLDEPAAGLSPPNADKLVQLIQTIRDEWKVSILLVEHAMSVVMAVSDRVAVLNLGKLIAEGTPGEVKENPSVVEAYLGATTFVLIDPGDLVAIAALRGGIRTERDRSCEALVTGNFRQGIAYAIGTCPGGIGLTSWQSTM